MYYGKMWLVVKPTVGIPLFFGGVALTSLAIHTAVLNNTTWYPEFYNGKGRPAATAAAPARAAAAAAAPGDSAQALASAQAALASAQAALASAQPTLSAVQQSLAPK